jgi:hypothetical protein
MSGIKSAMRVDFARSHENCDFSRRHVLLKSDALVASH